MPMKCMLPMATPIKMADTQRRATEICSRIITRSASHEASSAGKVDSSVIQALNPFWAHGRYASMPTKCMLQMPPPMAKAPVVSAVVRAQWWELRRAITAICSAIIDDRTAMTTDTATNCGSIQLHSGGAKPSPRIKNRSKITMRAPEAVDRQQSGENGCRKWPEAIAPQPGTC